MSIRPTIEFDRRSRDQFVGATREAARRLARAELTVAGQQWEEEVQNIVREELPRRDGERHKANTTHLENSFTHQLVEGGDGGFPMVLNLTIKPGVSAAKVAALEFGNSNEYEIAPHSAKVLRWGDHPQDLHEPRKSVIWSPFGPTGKGILPDGYKFMRRARDTVLARLKRRM